MTQTADSRKKRWLALMVLCLGVLMIVLDTTIVNVALPSIREDLQFTETSLVWVVNAYMLTFGGFLIAVLASLAAARTDAFAAAGAAQPVALNAGYQIAFLVGAVFAFAACAIGARFLRTSAAPQAVPAPATAQPAAAKSCRM